MEKKLTIEPSLGSVYWIIKSYKELVNFYEQYKNIRSEEEIRDRIKYVLKHKLKQKNEIDTLKWVLGENWLEDEESFN